MIGITSLKCPECGDMVMSAEGKTVAFCSSCGAKLMISNENERVIRRVDESKIKSIENNTLLELKRMEIKQKNKMLRLIISLILFGLGALMTILGIVIYQNGEDVGGILSLVGFIFMFSPLIIAALAQSTNNDSDNI